MQACLLSLYKCIDVQYKHHSTLLVTPVLALDVGYVQKFGS